jgi:hypothetical protein
LRHPVRRTSIPNRHQAKIWERALSCRGRGGASDARSNRCGLSCRGGGTPSGALPASQAGFHPSDGVCVQRGVVWGPFWIPIPQTGSHKGPPPASHTLPPLRKRGLASSGDAYCGYCLTIARRAVLSSLYCGLIFLLPRPCAMRIEPCPRRRKPARRDHTAEEQHNLHGSAHTHRDNLSPDCLFAAAKDKRHITPPCAIVIGQGPGVHQQEDRKNHAVEVRW